MSIFIRRRGLEEFLKTTGRRLLYGRRKTGKTFYSRRTLGDYDYYIVRRGGIFYDPENQTEYAAREFIQLCRRTDKIIIDEFHRAPPILFDTIQAGSCPTDIVLVTSTLHYHRKYTATPNAPLKGLFLTYSVGLISPLDLVFHPWPSLTNDLLERLIFYQEPVLVGRSLREIMLYSGDIARSLAGEVLAEEDYEATLRYHHILEGLSMGKTRISELSSYLYSRGLIPGQSPSYITKYIDAMLKIGLIEKIPVWGKRKSIYRHLSPLTHTAYYLNAKYGIWDIPVGEDFLYNTGRTTIPNLMEIFVERMLSQDCGLRPVKILQPEIDIALTRRRKPWLIAEVKWRDNIRREDLRKTIDKLTNVKSAVKLMITKEQHDYKTNIPILTLRELVEIIKEQPGCSWVNELSIY